MTDAVFVKLSLHGDGQQFHVDWVVNHLASEVEFN
jgi:hypothetical protein